ncbi:MAG: low molecular weight phosphotyrosine protein phosphatase [Eubacterium sp.]|nr:low molecular weight phosphotyrosine protein phosphatase [Eubacterium sp.]
MIKVLFICHGNICRSPMAQYVLQNMVEERGIADSFYIDSAATSTEEIGNGVHYGTRRKLAEVGIPCGGHRAIQLTKKDYNEYDYLIGMDSANMRNINRNIEESMCISQV